MASSPRAAANFAQTPHIRAVHGDGTRVMFEPADVIYVNARCDVARKRMARTAVGGRQADPVTADGFPTATCGAGSCSESSGVARNFLRAGSLESRSFPVSVAESKRWPRPYEDGAERVTRLYRRDDLPEDQRWLRAQGCTGHLTPHSPDGTVFCDAMFLNIV